MASEKTKPSPNRTEKKEVNGDIITIEHYVPALEQPEDVRFQFAVELTPLVAEGFMRSDPNDQELFQDVVNHVATAPRLLIARNSRGEAIAFIAADILEIEDTLFYDLGGIITSAKMQGSGLALDMLKGEISETKVDGLVLRTQNMRMYKLAAKVATLSNDLAAEIAPHTHYTKNLDGCINHGAYRDGHSLYEDEKRFAPQAIDWIDWRSGDALVVAGFVK